MRISLLTDGITPFVVGGMQRHSFLLAKYLATEGVKIDLYHYFSDPKEYSPEKVLEAFPEQCRSNIHSIHVPFEDKPGIPGHYVRACYRHSAKVFDALMERTPGDFIYAKGVTPWFTLEQRKKGLSLPKIGVKFHGMNMFQKQPNPAGEFSKYFFRRPTRWIMNEADYVFSYGGKITDVIAAQGIDRDKIISIPTGIEEEWLSDEPIRERKESKTSFLFVGRMDRLKGLPEIYKAIGMLDPEIRNKAVFHFVGDIPSDQQCEGPGIHFHGAIREASRMKGMFDQADVVLCPSISEGMPNVILEGMARGCAILATDVGAINMMVSSANGWLLPDHAPQRIAGAMAEAVTISPGELKGKMSESQALIRSRFLWPSIVGNVMQFLEQEVKSGIRE